MLFLLESPAGPAALGSRMLSPDNDDETAKNLWDAYEATGLPRAWGLHWNAVPWYVGDGKKNKTVRDTEVDKGRGYLSGLLDLAPDVRVVLAMGKHAQRSVSPLAAELAARHVTLLGTPHPSPIPAGVTRGQSLRDLQAAIRRAIELCRD